MSPEGPGGAFELPLRTPRINVHRRFLYERRSAGSKGPCGTNTNAHENKSNPLLKGILYKQMQVRCGGEASASLPSARDPEPLPQAPLPPSQTASLSASSRLHLAHVEHFKGASLVHRMGDQSDCACVEVRARRACVKHPS